MKYIREYKDIDWDDWEEEENDPYEVPYEFKGNEKFYKFLVDNDILEDYITNYYNGFNQQTTLKKFLKSRDMKNYIILSFDWSTTDNNYWLKYNRQWISTINNI